MQSQELTRSTPSAAPQGVATLTALSATTALVWVIVLVLAVPVGLVCGLGDTLLRLRRRSPAA